MFLCTLSLSCSPVSARDIQQLPGQVHPLSHWDLQPVLWHGRMHPMQEGPGYEDSWHCHHGGLCEEGGQEGYGQSPLWEAFWEEEEASPPQPRGCPAIKPHPSFRISPLHLHSLQHPCTQRTPQAPYTLTAGFPARLKLSSLLSRHSHLTITDPSHPFVHPSSL